MTCPVSISRAHGREIIYLTIAIANDMEEQQPEQDKEYFRDKLTRLKAEVTQRISAIDRDIRHEGMSADWSEQASERENDEVLESLGNSSEVELAQIRFALQRLDNDTYFRCAECGSPIPPARLELLPYTAHCVDCAEQLDL